MNPFASLTGGGLSLSAKICIAATSLVVVSLVAVAAVTGTQSSASANQASMALAHSAADHAASSIAGRLNANLAAVDFVARTVRATLDSPEHLTREQLNATLKTMALQEQDSLSLGVIWEPNGFDGSDARYAGKQPEYGASGRYMTYFLKDGHGGAAPGVAELSETSANPFYDIPKTTQRPSLSEPFEYQLDGKKLTVASFLVPIVGNGIFKGVIGLDVQLTQLTAMLSQQKIMESGQLALVSNGGLYVSNPKAELNATQADDIPAEGLAKVRSGDAFEYEKDGWIYIIRPVLLNDDIKPWAIRLSFPKAVATAASRELLRYTVVASVLCAVIATLMMVALLSFLMRPLRELSTAMTALSSGTADLSVRLATRGHDELAAIGDGFNRFVAKTNAVLSLVASSASRVSGASVEISQGNQDLSARTEQQASALQQTAASLDAITGTVQKNADSARTASALATGASAVAARGGQEVDQLVLTMSSINASSRKVADIIGVIDNIAFQTNILALNAAVEAARAGEQGRGFAVVASEVRNLAQRTAVAAKEVKELITSAVGQVERGSTLAENAGSTMSDVVESVQRVTDIVAEIAIACREQSDGIGQVNQAISQMDQVTQRNAALVEEAAAGAQHLMDQADTLVALVGQFKLDDISSEEFLPERDEQGRRAADAPVQRYKAQALGMRPGAGPSSATVLIAESTETVGD